MFILFLTGAVVAAAATFLQGSATDKLLRPAAAELLDAAADRAVTALQNQHRLAQQTMDALVPSVVRAKGWAAPTEDDFPRALDSIEKKLWAVMKIDPRVGHQVLFAGADGSFVVIRRVAPQYYQLLAKANGQPLKTTYRSTDALRTAPLAIADSYDPRVRTWYRWATHHRTASWAPLYSDFVSGQTRHVLVRPVYQSAGKLQGVLLIDAGIAPFSAILQSHLPTDTAQAFLLDDNEALIASASRSQASTDFDSPVAVSASPLRAVWLTAQNRSTENVRQAFRVTGEGPAQWGVTRQIEGPYGLQWHLVMTVPEARVWQSMVHTLISKQSVWVTTAIAVLLLIAAFVARRQANLIKAVIARAAHADETTQLVGLPQDVREIADRVHSISRQLRIDPLTGLLSRAAFIAQVQAHQAAVDRRSTLAPIAPVGYTLLFIDLNGFKAINDTHGHAAGDQVLKSVGRRLKQAMRREDAASRFGGDEFVVYMHGIDQADTIDEVCDKLREAIQEPLELTSGASVSVGAAIGVAVYPRDGQTFDELARLADDNMYAAKRAMKSLLGTRKDATAPPLSSVRRSARDVTTSRALQIKVRTQKRGDKNRASTRMAVRESRKSVYTLTRPRTRASTET